MKRERNFLKSKGSERTKPLDLAISNDNPIITKRILELYTEKSREEKLGWKSSFKRTVLSKANSKNAHKVIAMVMENANYKNKSWNKNDQLEIKKMDVEKIRQLFKIAAETNESKILDVIYELTKLPEKYK